MKLLRHILSHLFLIFFLIIVVSLFYYRSLLLPEHLLVKVNNTVESIYSPALKFSSNKNYFWAKEATPTEAAKPEVAVVEATPTEAAKPEVAVVEATPTEAAKPEVAVVEATPTEAAKPEVAVVEATPTKESSKSLDTQKQTPDSLNNVIGTKHNLLVNARTAFMRNNLKMSEQYYIQLTNLDHGNPDIYGELGNVYYKQGKWNEAGQAYYEAAVRLLAKRQYARVFYLQRIIKGLNPTLAEKLSQLIPSK